MVLEKKQVVILVTAVVMSGCFFTGSYLPLSKRIKAAESNCGRQQAAIDEAANQTRQIPALKAKLLSIQESAGKYESNIPRSRDIGTFLKEVARLMDENNLKDQVIQPGQEVETDKLSCIPINMKCKGRLSEMFRFFKSLDGLGRLVRIEEVRLTNDKKYDGEVLMETKAFIYYQPRAVEG